MNCSTCNTKIACKRPDIYTLNNITYPSCSICYATYYGCEYFKRKQIEKEVREKKKYESLQLVESMFIRCIDCDCYLDYVDKRTKDVSKIDSKDIFCELCYSKKNN